MRKFQKFMLFGALALAFTLPSAELLVSAQEGTRGGSVATGDRVYCGGFVSDSPVSGDIRIIGYPQQEERNFLGNGDYAYINRGSSQNIQVGETYQIVRPHGPFYHPFKNLKRHLPVFEKRGPLLGYFTDEIGFLKVIAVQEKTATVQITESCGESRLGDALIKYEKPSLPDVKGFTPINVLLQPNGKTTGQIVSARNNREFLSAADVVILDVGQKAGIKVGDYMTIFRATGSESVNNFRDDETAPKRTEMSDRYRGNDTSMIYPSVKKEVIRKQYPSSQLPRTIVGEMVITRVEGNTAVGIITRTQSTEVYVGDSVELQ